MLVTDGGGFGLTFRVNNGITTSLPGDFAATGRTITGLGTRLTKLAGRRKRVRGLRSMGMGIKRATLRCRGTTTHIRRLRGRVGGATGPAETVLHSFRGTGARSSGLQTSLHSRHRRLTTLGSTCRKTSASTETLTSERGRLGTDVSHGHRTRIHDIRRIGHCEATLTLTETGIRRIGGRRRRLGQTLRGRHVSGVGDCGGTLTRTQGGILTMGHTRRRLGHTLRERHRLGQRRLNRTGDRLMESKLRANTMTTNTFTTTGGTTGFGHRGGVVNLATSVGPRRIRTVKRTVLIAKATAGRFTSSVRTTRNFLITTKRSCGRTRTGLLAVKQATATANSSVLSISGTSFALDSSLGVSPSRVGSTVKVLIRTKGRKGFRFGSVTGGLPILNTRFRTLGVKNGRTTTAVKTTLRVTHGNTTASSRTTGGVGGFLTGVLSPRALGGTGGGFNMSLCGVIAATRGGKGGPFRTTVRSIVGVAGGKSRGLLNRLFNSVRIRGFIHPVVRG